MVVCPLCEHPQAQGDECEVCGRALRSLGASAVPVPALDGLEATRHEPAGTAPDDALPDLEPTVLAPVQVPVAPLVDLEATRLAAAAAVAGEPVVGLERTEVDPIPGDGPTPEPAAILCRYCRSPALPGEVLCGNCGMRLPVFVEEAVLVDEEAGPTRCPACGTAGGAGPVCPGCGALRR